MELIYRIADLVLWTVAVYFSFNCIYLGVFAVSGLFPVPPATGSSVGYKKIAVLFPTYQSDEVIVESAGLALRHSYGGEFKVVVIADGLAADTLALLREMGAEVIEVSFEKSTKGKALLFAVEMLKDTGYEIALVLDVDNHMGAGCLNFVNGAFQHGHKVIQLHRTAKNLDSSFAFLDACNEEVNNRIYRKGQAVLGFSPALIGSGMAFDYRYFYRLLGNIGETLGEDKKMDFLIASDGVNVAYLDDVFIYDEKVGSAKVFTAQRTRWIASQIEFIREYALAGAAKLFQGNTGFFNKTLQTLLMPRILLLGLLFLMSAQSFVNPLGPGKVFWSGLLMSLCLTLMISVPGRFYKDKRLYFSLLQIPRAMLGMVIALFSIGKVKKSNMATPHQHTALSKNEN